MILEIRTRGRSANRLHAPTRPPISVILSEAKDPMSVEASTDSKKNSLIGLASSDELGISHRVPTLT